MIIQYNILVFFCGIITAFTNFFELSVFPFTLEGRVCRHLPPVSADVVAHWNLLFKKAHGHVTLKFSQGIVNNTIL